MLQKFASAGVLEVEASRDDARLLKDAHRHEFNYEPRKGYLYVRSRAISSRTNDNYDTFPADELRQSWHTFIGKPVFVNHHNDDHTRMRGVVIDAVLHEDVGPDGTEDTWVEVLMEVDAKRFPKLAEALIKRDIERTSMGCDVIESECSFCGNVARQPNEYCAHIERMKGQRLRRHNPHTGQIEDVLVHEVCRGLSFFENSLLVEDPADPTAYAFGLDVRGVLDEGDDLAMLARSMSKAANRLRQVVNGGKVDPKLKRDYNNGWKAGLSPSPDALGKADARGVSKAWYAGFYDASDGMIEKYDAMTNPGSDWYPVFHASSLSHSHASLPGVGVSQETRVPSNVETLRMQKCPVCDSDATWNSDGRCDVCGYLPPPHPFREPDTDVAHRVDHGGGWFDPDLVEATPFTLASHPVKAGASARKGQKAIEQGAHHMSTKQPSVATAHRRRLASQASGVEQRLAQENAALREKLARFEKAADVDNPAQPVPEPAPQAPVDTDEDARNKPQAQGVDVENPGGALPDPQDAPGDVTAPGDEAVDPILAGTHQTDDVEVPVSGTTAVDPNAVEEVVPDNRAETFGEPAFRGDFLNPGPSTVPDIDGNAATARRQLSRSDRAKLGRMVAASRDRIWASLRLARLRIQAGLEQGDDIEVASSIESSDASMDVIRHEIATLSRLAQQRPAPAAAPRRTAARRTPSLAAGSQPHVGGLASRGDDEMLFE